MQLTDAALLSGSQDAKTRCCSYSTKELSEGENDMSCIPHTTPAVLEKRKLALSISDARG
eukprot:scaffold2116_cov140-Chaetoceros_neogracile.AAC.2